MTKLHPDKILRRVNGINIQVNSVQDLKISLNHQEMNCGEHSLLLLEAFARPLSVRQGLQKVNFASAYDWINLTDSLNELYTFGALRDPAEIELEPPPPSRYFWGFDSSPAHIAMLNDRNRTNKFIEAIRGTVKEGDVVVEIGTGSGVLAIAAARAGAARVFTIEAGAMARTAQKVIDGTEVAETIRVIPGLSHQVEIPDKADVLIGEIIGSDPFCERVLQAFEDARRRMLKPDARIIPQRLRVFGVPLELSPVSLKNKALTSENIENWKNWYGTDFSHLADNITYEDDVIFSLNADKAKGLNFLGEAFLIAGVDFDTFRDPTIQKTVTAQVSKAGLLNGILVYFELQPRGSQTITTDPDSTLEDSSWVNPIWYLAGAKQVNRGDPFTVRFSFNGGRHSRISLCDE